MHTHAPTTVYRLPAHAVLMHTHTHTHTLLPSACSDVLEEGGDVLVNVNMVDDDKAKKNVEVKKGKPLYNPFEQEEEEFELGEVRAVPSSLP